MCRGPRPARTTHSAIVAALASLSIPTGRPNRSCIRSRKSRSASGRFVEKTARPRTWSTVEGIPNPSAATPSSLRNSSTAASSLESSSACDETGVGCSTRRSTRLSRSTTQARILVPPRSTPMTEVVSTGTATITRRMTPAGGEKPYRVYRGGRIKGKVPTLTREQRTRTLEREGRTKRRAKGRVEDGRPKRIRTGLPWYRRWSWKRWLVIGIATLFTLCLIWGIASYFSFRSGVIAANDRLPKGVKKALTHQDGLLLSHSTNILLLG